MPVICSQCQKESQDEEFCDHCNCELTPAQASEATLPGELALDDGVTLDISAWQGRWPSDSDDYLSCTAFDRAVRVHGVAPQSWSELADSAARRNEASVACLPRMRIVEFAGGAAIVADSETSFKLPAAIPRRFEGDWTPSLRPIAAAIDRLATAIGLLHEVGYVWLNFDPDAVETLDDRLLLTNLDCRLFPAGQCPSTLQLSPLYSPPEAFAFVGERIGPQTDVYHLGMLAYLLIAGLPQGFAGAGLAAFSHLLPSLRTFQPYLPPGIAPVVARATAVDASKRYPNVRTFAEALNESVDELEHRYGKTEVPSPAEAERSSSFGAMLDRLKDVVFGRGARESAASSSSPPFDIGGACRTGRAKEAVGAVNQDAISFTALREAAIAVVADGVTNAKAGRGEIASSRACEAIEGALRETCFAGFDEFREALTAASLDGSRLLVAEALTLYESERAENAETPAEGESTAGHFDDVREAGERSIDKLRDADLMSSTIVAATWNAGQLRLATLGDSRAYLVTERYVDQLSVDGDVGAALLADEAPPEQVFGMGAAAKALQRCFGAARADDAGQFDVATERCTPSFAMFPTMPSEIVILCTDGLVDEGIFLEPSDIGRLVKENRAASAQQIAETLVAAADDRQRLPTPAEPKGFGDNIACIVLKTPQPTPPPAEKAIDG